MSGCNRVIRVGEWRAVC